MKRLWFSFWLARLALMTSSPTFLPACAEPIAALLGVSSADFNALDVESQVSCCKSPSPCKKRLHWANGCGWANTLVNWLSSVSGAANKQCSTLWVTSPTIETCACWSKSNTSLILPELVFSIGNKPKSAWPFSTLPVISSKELQPISINFPGRRLKYLWHASWL